MRGKKKKQKKGGGPNPTKPVYSPGENMFVLLAKQASKGPILKTLVLLFISSPKYCYAAQNKLLFNYLHLKIFNSRNK